MIVSVKFIAYLTKSRNFDALHQVLAWGEENGADWEPVGQWRRAYAYVLGGETVEDAVNREVKKRGAERLSWDASYKEPKHLARYHGEPLFRALITATNELGEVR